MRFEPSEELLGMMAALTAQQRAAIPRLVEVLGEGGSVRSLLHGPDKICTERTYYRRHRGWSQQVTFRRVLEQAQQEYDAARLKVAVEEAAERMRRTAPLSARLAEAVVRAALGLEGERPPAVERLGVLMERGQKESDQVRAAQVLLVEGMRAAFSVLDRADIETAVKSAGGAEQEWRDLMQELRGAGDEVADVEAEADDLYQTGLPSERGADPGT